MFFSCDVVQTSLQHLIHSVSSTIKAASSAQELFPLMVDRCGHQGTWSLIKDTHVGGRWIASSLSGSFSVIYTSYFGWCQEQNPSLHWLQVGMPICLWANDKDTWSRFLSSCGQIPCEAQSLYTRDEECLFTYKIYDKGTPALGISQDHRLHGLTLPLFPLLLPSKNTLAKATDGIICPFGSQCQAVVHHCGKVKVAGIWSSHLITSVVTNREPRINV